MKNFRLHITLFLTVLAAVTGFVSFETGSSRGQSKDSKAESGVKPTVLISDRRPDRAAENSNFKAASEQNAVLMNELTWTFGGKQQKGWYLYNALINQTLNRTDDAGSKSLAAAVAGWQQTTGLSGNGILEENTLMGMISEWQGNRLKDRTVAQPDQLLTAPSSGTGSLHR